MTGRLRRSGPLRRNTPLVWRGRPMRRGGRLRPMSTKRRADLPRRREVRAQVFERDGGCVATGWRGPCFGPLTPHHLRKASAVGPYDDDNLVTLCAFHNGLVEDHPAEATARGLVIR